MRSALENESSNVHTRQHRAVISSWCHAMLQSFAEQREGRRQRAAAAASDSLVVLSVSPPLESLGASSSPGRSSGADHILQKAGFCTHGRQRSRCKECGGSSICTHGRRQDKKPMQRVRGRQYLHARQTKKPMQRVRGQQHLHARQAKKQVQIFLICAQLRASKVGL
jgi:hypothetical protein